MPTYQPPACLSCAHHRPGALTCEAFPTGIPRPILLSEVTHKKPYPGDHGLRFKQSPTLPLPVVTPPPDRR